MAELDRPMFPALSKPPYETWQIGAVRLPVWLPPKDEGGKPFRIWVAACLNEDSGDALASETCAEEELPAYVTALLSRAAWKWRSRPARVQTEEPDLAAALEKILSPQGIPVETMAAPPALREFLDLFFARMSFNDPRPSPLTGTGVSIERLRAFARAAAAFEASSFWKYLDEADMVRVEAPEVDDAFRYFGVSRRGGQLSWLTFFPDAEDSELPLDDDEDEPLVSDDEGVWMLEFSPVWQAPSADLELWESYDLPWVRQNRCPVACFLGEDAVERPDRQQLAFLEGLLAALAVTSEEELDSGRWEKRVWTSEGSMDFVLALPGLLEPEDEEPEMPAFGWSVTEKPLRAVQKLLQSQDFSSLEEANEFIARSLADGLPPSEPETPVERAEELVDRAWRTPGRRAVLLARQALEIWPDCTDAYNLLASRAADPETSRELCERGLAAGKRALGSEIFVEEAGNFWGILETRPYMRALEGLAESLEELKRFGEAAQPLQEMLRLNPNDNQGARDSLVNVLLAADRDAEAEEVLHRYREDSSTMAAYPRALLRFRREGDSFEARMCLKRALKANQFVPGLLLGKKPFPPLSAMYSPGGEDEAVIYIANSCGTWQLTPGALDWLRQRTTLPPKPAAKGRARGKKKRRR